MSPAKAKELSTLFRKLARRFHPDLYPGDEERADYYATAQNALACGDVELLRALDVATAHMADGVDYSHLTVDKLAAECELLEDYLASCKAKLAELTSTEPYTLRDRLADPEWVSTTVDVLAYECFRHAAEAGIAEGCYKLGDMLTEGTGCTPDYAKALDMFLKAYRYGRDGSPRIWGSVALRLARAYANARGCALDYERALHWYTIARTGLELEVRDGGAAYDARLWEAEAGVMDMRQALRLAGMPAE